MTLVVTYHLFHLTRFDRGKMKTASMRIAISHIFPPRSKTV